MNIMRDCRLKDFKMSIIIGSGILLAVISIKALYYIGMNMGPPNDRKEALEYLRRNSLGLSDDCLNRLLNLGSLTDDEVLRFMTAENEGIWFLVGENLSVSDDAILKGYNVLTEEGKTKFRGQLRYWGWSQSRMKLAYCVWSEQKTKKDSTPRGLQRGLESFDMTH